MQFAKRSTYIISFEPHKNCTGKVLIISIFMSEAIERLKRASTFLKSIQAASDGLGPELGQTLQKVSSLSSFG